MDADSCSTLYIVAWGNFIFGPLTVPGFCRGKLFLALTQLTPGRVWLEAADVEPRGLVVEGTVIMAVCAGWSHHFKVRAFWVYRYGI